MLEFHATSSTIVSFLAQRLATMGERDGGLGSYYASFVRDHKAFIHYDVPIADFLSSQPRVERYIEIGAGIGQLPALLASRGMNTLAVESDAKRFAALMDLIMELRRLDPDIPIEGLHSRFPTNKIEVANSILIFTNIVTTVPETERPMLEACRGAAGIIMDMARFTRIRSTEALWAELTQRVCSYGFGAPIGFYEWGQPTDDQPEVSGPGRMVFFPML